MTDNEELRQYMENSDGLGILSTADSQGNVNSAIYARPHINEDGLAVFVMRERTTYKNLISNPSACYIFVEDGPGYTGKRIYLKKIREDSDSNMIEKMLRSTKCHNSEDQPRSIVYFEITGIRPLVGN